jgi:hypothetical protein
VCRNYTHASWNHILRVNIALCVLKIRVVVTLGRVKITLCILKSQSCVYKSQSGVCSEKISMSWQKNIWKIDTHSCEFHTQTCHCHTFACQIFSTRVRVSFWESIQSAIYYCVTFSSMFTRVSRFCHFRANQKEIFEFHVKFQWIFFMYLFFLNYVCFLQIGLENW